MWNEANPEDQVEIVGRIDPYLVLLLTARPIENSQPAVKSAPTKGVGTGGRFSSKTPRQCHAERSEASLSTEQETLRRLRGLLRVT